MTAKHKPTIGVIGTGDMGSAVGGALVRAGYRVVTAGQGRGAESHRLAAAQRIEDVGSLEAVVRSADLLLSIVPPAVAAAGGTIESSRSALRTTASSEPKSSMRCAAARRCDSAPRPSPAVTTR